ncbi:uncharacterized protein LOC110916326 isoform X3 [Helianthus annuus]|uniref:uncharacterized protein LOC110916326 isoform X3 n=1 Tax=Helianthus annuus TaxID=4232 RepID=UPI000B8F0CFB|nr:uncharacterized protein LOC110916326 isoform X3 [Helianthus annuus]
MQLSLPPPHSILPSHHHRLLSQLRQRSTVQIPALVFIVIQGRRALLVAKDKNPKISKAYSKTIQIKAESSPLLSYQSLLQMLKNDSCISSRTIHIIKNNTKYRRNQRYVYRFVISFFCSTMGKIKYFEKYFDDTFDHR